MDRKSEIGLLDEAEAVPVAHYNQTGDTVGEGLEDEWPAVEVPTHTFPSPTNNNHLVYEVMTADVSELKEKWT